jgi:hypothetical protein
MLMNRSGGGRSRRGGSSLKTVGSGKHEARRGTNRPVLGELVPVTFRFPNALAPAATRISILGPFNGWNAGVHAMQKTQGNCWAVTLYLPPGRAVYCFEVDGARRLDPLDDARIANSRGSGYSVRFIGAGEAAAVAGSMSVPAIDLGTSHHPHISRKIEEG